jgi:hypothetical protein
VHALVGHALSLTTAEPHLHTQTSVLPDLSQDHVPPGHPAAAGISLPPHLLDPPKTKAMTTATVMTTATTRTIDILAHIDIDFGAAAGFATDTGLSTDAGVAMIYVLYYMP